MYKEQFFPGVDNSKSELKPGEPETVEETHKPEIEERNSVRRINRRDFTLDDYVREWDSHPEWHGFSTKQAGSAEGRASGLGAFYVSFWKFANRESKGDEAKRSEIMQQFFPEKQVKRAHYRLEDYMNEWNAHPEWHGFSTEQATSKEGTASGLGAFYASLGTFANRESKGDEEKRSEIVQQFFPKKRVYRSHYRLEDYMNEWDAHPEWHGLSTQQAGSAEGRASGLGAFYVSFWKFANRESKGDEAKRREIMQQLFPEKQVKRAHYRLEDYMNEWNAHPEWHGQQVKGAEGTASGLGAFYVSLGTFANRESKGDEEKRSEIVQQFFPEKQVRREHYQLEDYINEWNAHPEWHGQQVKGAEGTASGLGAFYVSFWKFANRESKGDEAKRREIMQQLFPEKQVKRAHYRLEDYMNEWNAHPEWHGFSTEQAQSGRASGLVAFYSSLLRFANRESKGDEEKRSEIMERFFPFRVDKIYANRGYALQYSVETILKIIGNKNLSIEALVKRIDSDQRAVKPDLMYEYADGERALILDIKLQTTTRGIEKGKKNYSAVLQNKYPRGGNLVFLCLNGPDFPSERLDDNDRVRVRYYHILDFLERLADNRRNKFLLRLISGNEEQEISQVPELTPEQIGKITEIADQLKVLQKVVSERSFSTEDLSLEDASEKTKEIRLQLSKLAKTKATEENIAEIMSTDFKKLMDF